MIAVKITLISFTFGFANTNIRFHPCSYDGTIQGDYF